MAAKESIKAPLDQLTGLPLPIYYGPHHLGYERNFQHGWHSLNKLKSMLPNEWALALRISRGYLIPLRYHMADSEYGYHAAVDEGPDPPTDIDSILEAVALGISKVVPRQSMDMTREPGEYHLKTLNNRQHRFISKITGFEKEGSSYPGVEAARRDVIGRFLAEYSITRMLEENSLSPTEEEILLDTRQPLTRELGALVYLSSAETLQDSLPPVVDKFRSAKAEGMVSRKADIRTTVLSFMPSHRFGSYYYAVRDNLAREELPVIGAVQVDATEKLAA